MRCTNHRHRSRYCDHHYHHQNQVYFVLIDFFFKANVGTFSPLRMESTFLLTFIYIYTFFSLNLIIWGHCRINSRRLLCLSTPVKLYIPVKLKNRLWYIRILDGMYIISKVCISNFTLVPDVCFQVLQMYFSFGLFLFVHSQPSIFCPCPLSRSCTEFLPWSGHYPLNRLTFCNNVGLLLHHRQTKCHAC